MESPAIGTDGTIYFDSYNSSGSSALYAIGGASLPRSISTSEVSANIQVGQNPHGLAVDPANDNVLASSCSSISLIDGSSNNGPTANTVINTIYAPAAVFPQKKPVFMGKSMTQLTASSMLLTSATMPYCD